MSMIPELLEYGLPGFAVVLLLLGYRLLTRCHHLIFERTPALDSAEERRAWDKATSTMSTNARLFLGLSAFFFVGGLYIATIAPSNEIVLSVAPPEGVYPLVTLQEEPEPLDEVGKARIRVKDDSVIRVLNNDLVNQLRERTRERDDLRERLRQFVSATERDNAAVGF